MEMELLRNGNAQLQLKWKKKTKSYRNYGDSRLLSNYLPYSGKYPRVYIIMMTSSTGRSPNVTLGIPRIFGTCPKCPLSHGEGLGTRLSVGPGSAGPASRVCGYTTYSIAGVSISVAIPRFHFIAIPLLLQFTVAI